MIADDRAQWFRLPLLLALSAVAGRAGAQQAAPVPGSPLTSTALFAQAPASVAEQDGRLLALGHRYRATFDRDGVEFVPALGGRAPRAMPLRLQFVGAGRGQDLRPGDRLEPQREGTRVEFARGICSERYEATAAGLEQSFRFTTLPQGDGDLVVEVALRTGLQSTADADGLVLELPGVGGLRIGGVTGIDARGERCAGRLQLGDGRLRLSLPASFVDRAALPLVLDPLIGSVFNVSADQVVERNADAAFDALGGIWLVVWEMVFAANDVDVVCQRLDSTGALLLGRLGVITSGGANLDPSVANVRMRNRFVVVWTQNGNVLARSVPAGTGTQSSVITVAGTTDTEVDCDLGGDSTGETEDAVCVWSNATRTRLEAARIAVDANGLLTAHDQTTLSATGSPLRPRLSKGCGSAGMYLIVWTSTGATTGLDVHGCLVNRNLSLRDTDIVIAANPGLEGAPEVDGDGRNWVVAWAREGGDGSSEVLARAVSWNPQGPVFDWALLPGNVEVIAPTPAGDPGVIWTGSSALVTWTAQVPNASNVFLRALDPFTCRNCETATPVQVVGSGVRDAHLRGASHFTAGGGEDQALLVLHTGAATVAGGEISAQRWTSADGNLTDLGGGCGTTADAIYATCARVGNSQFRWRLTHAADAMPAMLFLSRDRADWPCGTCRLVPDPWTGVVWFATTSSSGRADLGAFIANRPELVGLSMFAQWLVANPLTPGCYAFGADLSPALRIALQ